MSYHISNLGSFAGESYSPADPAYYADSAGFVPQAGDAAWADAKWFHLNWDEWVKRAVRATARAEQRAQEWRER